MFLHSHFYTNGRTCSRIHHPRLTQYACSHDNPGLQIPEDGIKAAEQVVEENKQAFQDQFQLKESQMSISLSPASSGPDQVLEPGSADRLLALLLVLPHGVAKMSHAVEGKPR